MRDDVKKSDTLVVNVWETIPNINNKKISRLILCDKRPKKLNSSVPRREPRAIHRHGDPNILVPIPQISKPRKV
jgi:hypothetical protein